MHCIFCHDILESQIIYESEHFKVVFDIDPIQAGHVLIISKAHYMNYLELPEEVLMDLVSVERKLIEVFESQMYCYATTIARNNGNAMDTGTHFHVHVIPRYKEDEFWDGLSVVSIDLDLERFKGLLR
ncbi:HIT family protein [Macrococcus sp. DPC7161]|uniref:HIT family protein n=1 Tax=Macrococcus sp. DPC7161 TaxID=2507060 RepID=UPI00100A6097|nr:HIT family protein [Macrococcus sp. DPC7161]RXK18329.1 HIT family protein [Macrococcus sp. DPC7161]